MNNEVYETAVHEAAHAVMAFYEGEKVNRLEILDEPTEAGLLAFCRFTQQSKAFSGPVRIWLSGPCMSAIHEKTPLVTQLVFGGFQDFEDAKNIVLEALAPTPLRFGLDAQQVEPFDDEWLYEIAEGHWPKKMPVEVNKRRLRKFAKAYTETLNWVLVVSA